MKNRVRQLLSVVLTACMLVTMVPLTAYGADVDFQDDVSASVEAVEETQPDLTADTDVEIDEEEPDSTEDVSVETDDEENEEAADNLEVQSEDVFSSDEQTEEFTSEAVLNVDDCYQLTGASAPTLKDTFLKIVFVDCGRKYFSVESLKQIIDNAASSGFKYVELGVGNDGLRFLLDDMKLQVNGTEYSSEAVKNAIHAGNEGYYNFDTDELTESDMDTIIDYASQKNIGIIPLVNTPGHMDAILSAANSLTGSTCSYNGSKRTIDVSNATAVAFTNVRPASYYVQLLADDVKVGDKIILESASDFSKTWTGLQKNRTGKVGEAIVYTAEVTGLPESYETSVSGDAATGLVVKNTYIPATVEIPVSVKWDDAENQDGARLDSVEAELYANGVATRNKVTLNAENGWTAKFAKVDVKKDGTRIKYEVKGTEADGYDVSVAGDILDEKGLVLTYKHIPAVVNVSARASWNDANNQDGIRPTDTLVQLYADGTALGDKAVIESNKEWTKTWSDLPKYKAGKEIAYSVIAYAVSGYTVKVTGSALEGYKAEYTHNVQKMNVTVQNAWNDLDNVVDSRPAQLVVEIYANGKTTGKRVTLTEANNWKATVSGLDRNAAGKRIQYTGKAVGTPAGYNISVSTDANGNIKLISNFTTYTKKLRLKLSKTSYVYNGKNAKPKVTVYNGRKKVSRKYYKVTYKNNKNTGYATVIVKGKGKFAKYAGKATFTIKPKTPKKPVVKKGAKKTLNVRWYRDAQATKYVVQYSQSSKFKGRTTKTVTINSNKTGKIVLKGLTSRKNYYVRVRSCKVVNGKAIWGSYSKATKMKVK